MVIFGENSDKSMSLQHSKILPAGLYLVLEPIKNMENLIAGFKLGCYNNTLEKIDISIELAFRTTEELHDEISIASDEWVEFNEIDLALFNDAPNFYIHLEFESGKEWQKKVKPKAKQIARQAPFVAQLEACVYSYEIWKPERKKPKAIPKKEILTVDAQKLREALLSGKAGTDKIMVTEASDAVDIHAEKLQISSIDISDGLALDVQIAAFEKALDAAVANDLHSFLVIHGRGSGILRNEVHRVLKAHQYVRHYSLCNEGGATIVQL